MIEGAKPVGVMHLVDTLALGGAETVAVKLVNLMPRGRWTMHLCTTRRDGPLSTHVQDDVSRLRLGRSHTFEWTAIRELVRYIRERHIGVLHAHSTTVFTAVLAARFTPHPSVVWHDHFGRFGTDTRNAAVYGCAVRRVDGVIAVTRALAGWSEHRLKVPPERIRYIPNFVVPMTHQRSNDERSSGPRIVCVANLRPNKDHPTLLRAMKRVTERIPETRLLLVGDGANRKYVAELKELALNLGLDKCVSFLGTRTDVSSIIAACDVGVLSSSAEGFPLALLEYGAEGLAAVATAVGGCSEILEHGTLGVIVPPKAHEDLAAALIGLLQDADRRRDLGERLRARVKDVYGPERAIAEIEKVYEMTLSRRLESSPVSSR